MTLHNIIDSCAQACKLDGPLPHRPRAVVSGRAAYVSHRHTCQGYLLDCPADIKDALMEHIKIYKLRSKIKLRDITKRYEMYASGVEDPWAEPLAEGDAPSPGLDTRETSESSSSLRLPDPRCRELGLRLLLRREGEGTLVPLAMGKGGAAVLCDWRFFSSNTDAD